MLPTGKAKAVTMARRIAHGEPWAHLVILVVALVLAIPPTITEISVDWSAFSLDWKTYAAFVILLTQGAVHGASRLYLRSTSSGRIGKLQSGASFFGDYRIVRLDSRLDLDELAEYLDEHYPADFVSQLQTGVRRELYERWSTWSPGFAHAIRKEGGETQPIVGCCVLLPITQTTFAYYRNRLGAPTSWTPDNVGHDERSTTRVFFMPALHVRRDLKEIGGDLLAELFTTAAGKSIGSQVHDVVIVAPIRTSSERENAKDLGFEMYRTSGAGFELWELDGRRLPELSRSGQMTFEAISQQGVV